jgi:hypothetical protein
MTGTARYGRGLRRTASRKHRPVLDSRPCAAIGRAGERRIDQPVQPTSFPPSTGMTMPVLDVRCVTAAMTA